MKSIHHYNAAVADLETAILLIGAVNQHFPQYRVQTRDLDKQLKKLTAARDKREKSTA